MINEELKYLHYYLPNYSDIQKKIYLDWKNRLEEYYHPHIQKLSNDEWEEIFFTKNLKYFFPEISLLENPFHIPDMQKGIEIMRNFFEKDRAGIKKKIILYGDRDTDGVVSSSIVFHFFKSVFEIHEIKGIFPLREDKYGITIDVALRLEKEKFDLAIMLDCGSSNAEEIKTIKKNTNQIIIMDHHTIPQREEEYPAVEAFINPKRLPALSYDSEPATAGLAFKFIWAFVYSFSSAYKKNQIVQWQGNTFSFYHGEKRDDFSSINNEPPFDLDQYWKKAAENYRSIHQIDQFMIKSGFEKSPRLPYIIYENNSMRNVRKKILPYLPLAATGTIVDMMPVIDDNKIIISEGLKYLNQKSGIAGYGFEALLRRLKLWENSIVESDISFFVGPVLNAPGRLSIPDIAFKLLTSTVKEDAAKKAFELISVNEERKKFSKEGYDLALSDIRIISDTLAFTYHPEIHPGISGLVANKIADHFKKPALVLVDEGPSLRGSVRAYNNEDVFDLLNHYSDFFIQYGGHKGAAGFSIEHNRLDEFVERLEHDFNKGNYQIEVSERIGSKNNLDEKGLNSSTWNDFLTFSPYGVMNPHPTAQIHIKSPIRVKLMGTEKRHARILFDGVHEKNVEGVWFFHNGEALQFDKKMNLSITAEPHFNYYQNKIKYQLKIKKVDIASN